MPRAGWLAVGAAAAALVVAAGLGSLPIIGVLGVALVVAAAGLSRGVSAPAIVRIASPLAFSVAGALAILLRTGGPGGFDQAPPDVPEGSGPWAATVVAVGSPRDGQQTAMVSLEVDGEPVVAATLPRYPDVEPGDRVRLNGAIRPPGDDAYGQYLVRIGAVGTVRARAMDLLEPSTDPAWIVERLRRTAGEALTRAIPEPAAGLSAGILIGLRDRVDRELAAAFTTAGVSHVVAISGWNIAIVAGLVAALLRGVARRRRAVLTVAVIAAYVALAGASPSVLRAAVMAGVVLIARETGRAGRAAAVLGIAATLLLVLDPRLVLDAGFQLSTVATAGLIAWATPIAERLAGPDPGRLRRWLADSLGVSLAAQAATLPIVLAAFGRLSLVAPAVNLLVVPLVPAAMAAGVVALVAGWASLLGLPNAVAVVSGLPAWAVLGAIITVVRAAAGLPLASVGLEPPWSVAAGAASAVVVLAVSRRSVLAGLHVGAANGAAALAVFGRRHGVDRRARAGGGSSGPTASPRNGVARKPVARRAKEPWRRLAGIAVVGGIGALSVVAIHRPDGATHIVVLDVGQGDAILVEGARGGRILLDSGPDPDRLLVALDERLPPWDRRLDAVVLTHPHEDHVAGAALLLDRYEVGRVLETGMHGPGPGYAAAHRALEARGTEVGTLAAGDRLRVDDLAFTVLWPDRGRVPLEPSDGGTAINNVSIVLLGEVAGRRLLLTGDIEQGIDPVLLGRGLPSVDFLKVAHHGSGTATTGAFLDATRPAVAAVSAGAGNPYGHPAPATLARLEAHGARVVRTDLDGDVDVTVEGTGALSVRTAQPPKAAPTGRQPASAGTGRTTNVATMLAPPAPSFACTIPVLSAGPSLLPQSG